MSKSAGSGGTSIHGTAASGSDAAVRRAQTSQQLCWSTQSIEGGGSNAQRTHLVIDHRRISIIDDVEGHYLRHVGTLLSDGHFAEAKQAARERKEAFEKRAKQPG